MSRYWTVHTANDTILIAGIPDASNTLYHRIRFLAGDPAVFICQPGSNDDPPTRTLIIRDIEIERARQSARVDNVTAPGAWVPAGGLSGDRETATAQAAAEFLRQSDTSRIRSDRTLPLIFADALHAAGIEVEYDPELGVMERRCKDEEEMHALRAAQSVTEEAMAMACHRVAGATSGPGGILLHEGEDLTSERLDAMINTFLLQRGYMSQGCIVASGPTGADCHHRGAGPLRTGEPVIIDIFPRSMETRYHGDCTRTVVHGDVPDEVDRMHRVVVEAKAAATAHVRSGTSGEDVHAATTAVIRSHGYEVGLPGPEAPDTYCGIVHGTGHGIGLDVHEPPLLANGGPALLVGDVITIEPGLYSHAIGGIRIEDMVVVTEDGCDNFNRLPEGLDWT